MDDEGSHFKYSGFFNSDVDSFKPSKIYDNLDLFRADSSLLNCMNSEDTFLIKGNFHLIQPKSMHYKLNEFKSNNFHDIIFYQTILNEPYTLLDSNSNSILNLFISRDLQGSIVDRICLLEDFEKLFSKKNIRRFEKFEIGDVLIGLNHNVSTRNTCDLRLIEYKERCSFNPINWY